MLKMVIELDEEKIKKEGKYDLQKMYAHLDENFVKSGLKVEELGVYTDNGNEYDLNEFMALATVLSDVEWFKKYIKTWDWYEEDLTEPENLLKTFEMAV